MPWANSRRCVEGLFSQLPLDEVLSHMPVEVATRYEKMCQVRVYTSLLQYCNPIIKPGAYICNSPSTPSLLS